MNNELMIFEEHQVEVIEINGQVLFNPYDVGKCLELEESSIRNYTSQMNINQVVKLTNSDILNADTRNWDNPKVFNKDFRKVHNTGENFLTESGVYKLVFKSRK